MPLYDYACPDCGAFRAWRPMSESDLAIRCPDCAGTAQRAMVAPSLALMASTRRTAHARNEKSADQPVVASRAEMGRAQPGHACHGHGRAGHHPHPGRRHGPSRPWMIGH
jgi:putative FmdB family regulatory protein